MRINADESLEILDALFAASDSNLYLTDIQELVFLKCWEKYSYQQIADQLGYDCDYIKKVGSQLWRSISKALGKKATKSNFQSLLRQYALEHQINTANLIKSEENLSFQNKESLSEDKTTKVDWGEASDVSIFYGRQSELDKLESWVIQDKCRLIAILAMGGMGKTAVSIKLAQQLQPHFDYVIWRTVRDSPLLSELLADIIKFIDNGESIKLADSTKGRLSQLIKYLKKYRCLIVIDNFETVLQPNNSLNLYRNGYEDYGELLRRVGDVLHQSCVVVTSREKPEEIAALQGDKLPVRVWQLQGLDEISGRELLQAKGLQITTEDSKQLVKSYQGNALAIKIAATAIQDIFAGDVIKFLAQDTRVFNGLRLHLSRHFERLSNLEKEIMFWLAINREPVNQAELQTDIIHSVSSSQILETIEYLSRRSLIERTTTGFTQQPVIMEYVTEKLIEIVVKEITTGNIALFNSYALIKPQGKDYIKYSQVRIILQPLVDKLLIDFCSKQQLEEKLKLILVQLRNLPSKIGYAAGNIINIFHYLKIDLTGFDFSNLPVWQADLRTIQLHSCNFSRTDLSKSVFAENIGSMISVAFSPDGQLLATGDTNSEIEIWQVPQYKRLLTLRGHQSPLIWSLAFSHDGRMLASGAGDRSVKVWDVATGKCLQTLQGHQNMVTSVAFSPRRDMLVSGGKDGTVKFWQVYTGECIATIVEEEVGIYSTAFNSDGSLLAIGYDGGKVILWDVTTRKLLFSLTQPTSQGIPLPIPIAFSPDSSILTVGYADGKICLWDIQKRKCFYNFDEHSTQILELSFSADGNQLTSISINGKIRRWNIETSKCVRSQLFQEQDSRMSYISLNSDGQTLVSVNEDGTQVRLWNIKTGKGIKLLKGYNSRFWSIAFSLDGQTIYSGSEEGAVKIWDAITGKCRETLTEHQERVKSVAISPNGKILASASYDYQIIFRNPVTGNQLKTLTGVNDYCFSLVFSPDNKLIATTGTDGTVHLWDANTGQCQQTFKGHQGYSTKTTFNLDGSILASVGIDTTVKLWNIQTGNCFQTLTEHQSLIWDIATNPVDNTFITGSADRTVKLWDFTTGECLKTFLGHQQGIMSVAFSNDGRTIASGSEDFTIRIWDVVTGECLHLLANHDGAVASLSFSSQPNILASASFDETIKLWDITTGKCLQTMRSPKLYENMNITRIEGLTEAQKMTLKALGAFAE